MNNFDLAVNYLYYKKIRETNKKNKEVSCQTQFLTSINFNKLFGLHPQKSQVKSVCPEEKKKKQETPFFGIT